MRSVSWRSDALAQIRETPGSKVVITPMRLDFGGTPAVAMASWGDDYYDVGGSRPILGDTVQHSDDTIIRAFTRKAAGVADTWHFTRLGTAAATSYLQNTSTATCNSAYYVRPGLAISGDTVRLFYINTAGRLSYLESSDAGQTWGAEQDVGAAAAFDGAAVAPVSTTELFLFYLKDKRLYAQRWYHSGSWFSESAQVLSMHDGFVWGDAHWCDAEPVTSSTRLLVFPRTPNISMTVRWGSAHKYAEARYIVPVHLDYPSQRMRVASLSTVGSRIWAVCWRGIESGVDANTTVYYPFWELFSTPNGGISWQEHSAMGYGECRGKLHAQPDRTLVISAGCAYESASTPIVGEAGSPVTVEGDVVGWGMSMQLDNASDARTVLDNRNGVHQDAYTIGSRLERYFRIGDNDWVLLSTEKLDGPGRRQASAVDEVILESRGPIGYLVDFSPPVDEVLYSGISQMRQFDQLSVAAKSGNWSIEDTSSTASSKLLRGSVSLLSHSEQETLSPLPLLALDPERISGNFLLRTKVVFSTLESDALRTGEAVFLAFWSDDQADTYYRAGLFNDAGSMKWKVQKVVEGSATDLASSTGISVTQGSTLYLELAHRDTVLTLRTSTDQINWTTRLTYTYALSDAPPFRAHPGLGALLALKPGLSFAEAEETYGTETTNQIDFDWLYFRESAPDQSRHDFLRMISVRAGVEMALPDLVLEDFDAALGSDWDTPASYTLSGSWLTVADTFLSAYKQGEVDARLVVDLSTGDVELIYGSGSRYRSNLYAHFVRLSPTAIGFGVYENGTATLQESYPFTISGQPTVRVAAHGSLKGGHLVSVWVDNVFAAGTWRPGNARGFLGLAGSGGKVDSFHLIQLSDYQGAWAWPQGISAKQQVLQTIQGLWLNMVEQPDGTISLVPVGQGGDLGSYGTILTDLGSSESDREWHSIVTVDGAEHSITLVDMDLLRRGVRYDRVEAPHLWTEEECLDEAVRYLKQVQSFLKGRTLTGHLDPAAMVGDHLQVDIALGTFEGIIQRLAFSVNGSDATMTLEARMKPPDANYGRFDVDQFDSGAEFK